MPGRHCAVAVCKNNSIAVRLNNANITFHRFPKAKVSKTARAEWIRRCQRADKFNPDTSQICSIHFCETDYERDLQNELLNLPIKKRLKKDAIPTLYLGLEEKKSNSAIQRNERAALKQRKLEIEQILASNIEACDVVPCDVEFVECSVVNEVDDSNECWKEKYQQLLIDYKELERKYEELQKKHIEEKQDLLVLQKRLRSQNAYYKCKTLNFKTYQPNPFSKIFRQNQMDLILKKYEGIN
ncbi:hypothetical protein AMK59_3135 [Oryctes borbonicus]|uniref:THAP-type domain-containing protein n=1 Tax=Oryctes borbonicus TaxID=1629725 RepID=A0A0T6B7G9_9SCAR|nr:hypothetical protein AMK59_3135 [Oryctes borbonicus]